jgi:hypothetical protein
MSFHSVEKKILQPAFVNISKEFNVVYPMLLCITFAFLVFSFQFYGHSCWDVASAFELYEYTYCWEIGKLEIPIYKHFWRSLRLNQPSQSRSNTRQTWNILEIFSKTCIWK